jgi:mannose-1-phosphate guanylyltransferase
MLQETVRRLRGAVPPAQLLVVAAAEFAPQVRRQLPRLTRGQLVIEPAARGTAAAIALAAERVAQRDSDAVMAVFPADHAILDPARFRRALARAVSIASLHHCLVTFGVPPTSADTGYGYIEVGAAIDRRTPRAFWATRFHEKPDAKAARKYVRAGRFLWNSGMFVWRLDVIRETFAALAPSVAAAAAAAGSARRGGRPSSTAYRRLSVAPVDVAILERAPQVAVVEGHFGWSDVGSWAALAHVWGTDRAGNAVRGRAILVDSHGTVVVGGGRLVATVGVHDLIIVDSPDAVLICHKDRAQDVRRVVEVLRRRHPRFC